MVAVKEADLELDAMQRGADVTITLATIAAVSVALFTFITLDDQYVSLAFAGTVGIGIFLVNRFARTRLQRIATALARQQAVALAVSACLLAAVPFIFSGSTYWIHVFTLICIFGIVAQGLNVHLGEIGAINVGYAGFFAIGAYCSAILTADFGISFWWTLLWATGACWVAGLLVGACTIRTTGDYLALVTLGFGLVVYQLVVNMSWLTHGGDGIHIPPPSLFGRSFHEPINLGFATLPRESNIYYVALAFLALAMFLAKNVSGCWIGRTWAAMRQDRVGASCFGINVPVMQILSFAYGAAFAGVAGALYAAEIGFIEPREFTIFLSITAICMVILGGMGNWWGVIAGVVIMIIVPEKLRDFQEMRYFLYGLVLLLILIYRPFGLFPSPRRKHEQVL